MGYSSMRHNVLSLSLREQGYWTLVHDCCAESLGVAEAHRRKKFVSQELRVTAGRIFQPTIQPTELHVLYDFRVLRQSPRLL